jgi:CHASE3 domain sensor protein
MKDSTGKEKIVGGNANTDNITKLLWLDRIKSSFSKIPELSNGYKALNDKIDNILEKTKGFGNEQSANNVEKNENSNNTIMIILGLLFCFAIIMIILLVWWFKFRKNV